MSDHVETARLLSSRRDARTLRQIKAGRAAPGVSRRALENGSEVPEGSRQLRIGGRIEAPFLDEAVLQGRRVLLGMAARHRIVVPRPGIAKLLDHEVGLDAASLHPPARRRDDPGRRQSRAQPLR